MKQFTPSFPPFVIGFFILAGYAVSNTTHAADCTNVAVPASYGAAYNLFSVAKELLIKGARCTHTSFTITVGSGGSQYVYKQGYRWSGTNWASFILAGGALQGDTWYTGSTSLAYSGGTSVCGNGTCEAGETSASCSADCGGGSGGGEGNQNAACSLPKNDLAKNPFNKDSAFHRPIGTGAVYASDSDQSTVDWRKATQLILNVGKSWGFVIVEGKATDPLITVPFDPSTPQNYGSGEGLPVTLRLPPGLEAYTADGNTGIYDGEKEILHEVYRLYNKDGQYMAALHKQISARGLGHTPPRQRQWTGISASGMSEFLTTLRGFEVNTVGFKIQHALNVTILTIMAGTDIVWPAATRDGFCSTAGLCTGHIPYGALFAIPPVSKGGPDLNSLGLSEPGKRVAEALRDYGMYFYDTGGSVNMRTDQDISSQVASQVKADLTKLYNYFRMVKNNSADQTASGGGTPLAPNCAFDAQ